MRVFIFLLASFVTLSNYAQESFSGTYALHHPGTLDETLTLHPDGTFEFTSLQYFESPNKDKQQYGRGTWSQQKKVVTLHVKESDLDDKYTLLLDNSRAVSNRRSPRNRSTEPYDETLRFFESGVFWFKGRTFTKQ